MKEFPLIRIALLAALALVCMPAAAQARHHHHGRHHHHAKLCTVGAGHWPNVDDMHLIRVPCAPLFATGLPAPSGGGLIDRARSYLGTNPTGWRHVWCGKFMALVAPGAAAKVANPALARSWASLPHTGPRVGSIAVMARRGGGHVGVVSGFDGLGNPIIVSGNNRGAVREGAYPASRVLAYVSAD